MTDATPGVRVTPMLPTAVVINSPAPILPPAPQIPSKLTLTTAELNNPVPGFGIVIVKIVVAVSSAIPVTVFTNVYALVAPPAEVAPII